MATLRRRTLALAPLLTVALVAGCGDDSKDDLLSSGRAASLEQHLDRVEQTVESGDCETASAEADALEAKIRALPERVDSDLRDALAESAARLQTLVEESCRQQTETTPPVETVAPETESVPQEETDEGEGKGKGKGKGKGPKEDDSDEQPPPVEEEPPAADGGSEDQNQLDPESGGVEP